ncbi:TPA: hypothetical protein ACTXXA_000726 [Legionella anisa]
MNFKEESEATISKIRKKLKFGSNNDSDKDHVDFKRGNAIRAVVPIAALLNALCGNNPTFHVFAKLNALCIEKYGYGQCGEQSQAAFIDLIEKGVYPIDFCVTTLGGHNLLVVGRDLNSDPKDISTWGKNAFICDPWANKVYPAREFKKMQEEDFINGNYNKEIYKKGTMPPHYLSGRISIVQSVKNEEELNEFRQNIKLDEDISNIFSLKITSDEELNADLETMKSYFAGLSNSHLGSNPGALPALLQASNCLMALEKNLEKKVMPAYTPSIFKT